MKKNERPGGNKLGKPQYGGETVIPVCPEHCDFDPYFDEVHATIHQPGWKDRSPTIGPSTRPNGTTGLTSVLVNMSKAPWRKVMSFLIRILIFSICVKASAGRTSRRSMAASLPPTMWPTTIHRLFGLGSGMEPSPHHAPCCYRLSRPGIRHRRGPIHRRL